MESVAAAAIATTSRFLPLPFSSTLLHRRRRAAFLPVAAPKRRDDDEEAANGKGSGSGRDPTSLAPYGLSKKAALGLVVSAARGSGWTTGLGMEGPPTASKAGGADRPEVSTLPWSLFFTKSPRRRMRVAFTCNVCGQRTTRAINPHAYTDGTVFVQAWRLVHVSCFKYIAHSESSWVAEQKEEEVESTNGEQAQSSKEGGWFVRLQKIKEDLRGKILRFQTERWTVPWTGETIAQVMILWIATFWLLGSWIVPFLAHAAGFSKETLTHRGQAVYSLLTDIIEGLAGIAILHQCLDRFRPFPPGWFEFNLKGRWHLDVALGCLLFPLVNLLSNINISLVPMSPGPVVRVSSVERSIVARDPVAMALYAVVVTVCAPIWEEIVFRGFLLPSLTRYMPLPCSILASAAAFALVHFNAQRVMPLMFLGVVMGGVFARSRNLFASMVLHSLWNCFVFLDLMK